MFPLKICLCSLFPEITPKLVLSVLISKMVYVRLFPKVFHLCSPVPKFKLAMFSSSPKPLGEPQKCLQIQAEVDKWANHARLRPSIAPILREVKYTQSTKSDAKRYALKKKKKEKLAKLPGTRHWKEKASKVKSFGDFANVGPSGNCYNSTISKANFINMH